jgi:DNA replication protein DnaC
MSRVAATAPAPELGTLRETLTRLNLEHAAAALGTILGDAVRDDLGHGVFLDRLLTPEAPAREEGHLRSSLKLLRPAHGTTLACFDFAFQPAVKRRRIETLTIAL